MRAFQFWVETTYSLLSPPNKREAATQILLSPPAPPLSSLSNVKYLFLFGRGLCARCWILDPYQASFQFGLLSLLCLLLSAPFSVAEALINTAYISFHFITLFLLLHYLRDEKLIVSPLWTPLWWLKVIVSVIACSLIWTQSRGVCWDMGISHCDCSLVLLI